MKLEDAVKHVQSKLLDYALVKELQGTQTNINVYLIEPALTFLGSNTTSVPLGAFVGNLSGLRQEKIKDALDLLEALVECQLVKCRCVNGNWIIDPLNLEFGISHALKCSKKPMEADCDEHVFCGKVIHKPQATRIDHLNLMNSIRFKFNREFIDAFPEIPSNVPYIKSLPHIMDYDGDLYLRHVYDTRLRTYCASHVNYQGTEWEKCLLKFAKEEKLSSKGRQNLKEYISNLKPKEKYLRYNAELALKQDKTGIFIGADASASGMQLISLLRGCEKTATNVGLLDKNNDAYTLADKHANLTVSSNMDSRELFKACCMQTSYGGTATPQRLLGERNITKFYNTMWTLFPTIMAALDEFKNIYWETPVFKWHLPDDAYVQQAVIETSRVEMAMPNYPEVKFGYAYKHLVKKDSGLELAANIVHSVDGYVARELIYRASKGASCIDEIALRKAIKQSKGQGNPETVFSLYKLLNTPKDKWALLGYPFLMKAGQYMQASRLKLSKPFQVIAIHDDFKCHPNYIDEIKWLYIEILASIAESTLLKDIIEELNPAIKYTYQPAYPLAKKLRQAEANGMAKGLT